MNFENLPVFDKVNCRIRWLTFLAHPVDAMIEIGSTSATVEYAKINPQGTRTLVARKI